MVKLVGVVDDNDKSKRAAADNKVGCGPSSGPCEDGGHDDTTCLSRRQIPLVIDDTLTMVMELDDNCVACGQEDNISSGSKGGSKNRNKDPDWEAFLKTYKR